MANRYSRQFNNTIEPQVYTLFAKVSFGSTGAPTLIGASSKGFKSISRVSAGKYNITLGNAQAVDTYPALLHVKHVFDESSNSGTAPVAPGMFITSNLVSSTGVLQVVFNAAGTATDPASTEIVYLEVVVKNSTAY